MARAFQGLYLFHIGSGVPLRNADLWFPTKFVQVAGRLRATRDRRYLAPGSFLIADLVAGCYDEALPRHCTGALLDLGCGHVPLYAAYRARVAAVTCADWSNTLHKNPYLDAEVDLTAPLPFPSAAFDTILLSDVLEHLPEPALLWQEMQRVLRPGGKLIMNVPFYYPIHEAPWDFYRYSRFALTRFAETSGFKVISLEPVGGLPEVFTDLGAKLLARLPGPGRWAARGLQCACLGCLRLPLGRKASRSTGETFPLGYFGVFQKP